MTIAAGTFAEPLNKAEIPATATWMIHFDCEKAKASEMGQLMLNRDKTEKEKQGLEKFIEKCGFNPVEDITSVSLFGDSFDDKDGILVVRGSMSTGKLDALLETAQDHATSTYGNHVIHTWLDKHHNRPATGCFYDSKTILLAQNTDKLKTALDTLDNTAKGLDDTSAEITVPDVKEGVYLIVCAERKDGIMGHHPHAAMLRNAEKLVFALGETDGNIEWEFQLTARTPEDAALMNQIITGMISYSLLSGDKAPKLAEISKSVSTSSADNMISVALTYPALEMYNIIKSWKENQPKWQHKHHRKQSRNSDGE